MLKKYLFGQPVSSVGPEEYFPFFSIQNYRIPALIFKVLKQFSKITIVPVSSPMNKNKDVRAEIEVGNLNKRCVGVLGGV